MAKLDIEHALRTNSISIVIHVIFALNLAKYAIVKDSMEKPFALHLSQHYKFTRCYLPRLTSKQSCSYNKEIFLTRRLKWASVSHQFEKQIFVKLRNITILTHWINIFWSWSLLLFFTIYDRTFYRNPKFIS